MDYTGVVSEEGFGLYTDLRLLNAQLVLLKHPEEVNLLTFSNIEVGWEWLISAYNELQRSNETRVLGNFLEVEIDKFMCRGWIKIIKSNEGENEDHGIS